MYASLRGAASSEDSAKLNRRLPGTLPAKATITPSYPDSIRSFSLPIELPTPLADTFIARELVPPPLRPHIETTKTSKSARSAKAPIAIRGKRSSVSDLVGKFEFQDSTSDFTSSPLHRAATAPSPRLKSVYLSKLPREGFQAHSPTRQLPRRRLVSNETIYEEGCPFTLEQVSAATSFTAPKTRQRTFAELPEAPPLCRDAGVQACCKYQDQTAQVSPAYRETAVQQEHLNSDTAVQVPSISQGQSRQFTTEYNDRAVQVVTPHTDQPAQSASADDHHSCETLNKAQAQSEAAGGGCFLDQASQTNYDIRTVEEVSTPRDDKSANQVVQKAESVVELGRVAEAQHSATGAQSESQSSTELAFLTARNCSGISQLHGNSLSAANILFVPNAITIDFPEGTRVRMLQRISGGKIVIEPATLPHATSSEALAEGEVYTPGYVREEDSEPAGKHSPTASCSECSSVERPTASAPKAAVREASDTAEGSHYAEGQSHDNAGESADQPEANIKSAATPQADQVISQTTSLPELPNTADSRAQVAHRARSNGKRRASSVSYWFESDNENPNPTLTRSLRPQTLSQSHSVPLIRVQRPSTDSEMVFGLGTKAVKPGTSTSPLVPTVVTPAVQAGDVAPDVTLPTASGVEKKHLREHLRNRTSKKPISMDTSTGGKASMRARVKRKRSNVGRKGREKFVFRRKVLRILLGKELAEKVSQILHTTHEAAGATGGAAEAVHGVASGAGTPLQAPTSSTSKIPLHAAELPLGVTPLAPVQMDGCTSRSNIVSSHFPTDTSVASADTDVHLAIPEFDGLHEENKAKCHAKKEQKRNEKHQQSKTNLEALTSTPCNNNCGRQKKYILGFVYENKKLIELERPWKKRRDRGKEAKTYTEGLKCYCPKTRTTSRNSRHNGGCGVYYAGGDGRAAAMVGATAASGGAAIGALSGGGY